MEKEKVREYEKNKGKMRKNGERKDRVTAKN